MAQQSQDDRYILIMCPIYFGIDRKHKQTLVFTILRVYTDGQVIAIEMNDLQMYYLIGKESQAFYEIT